MSNYKALPSVGHIWRLLKEAPERWKEKARLYCESKPLVIKALHKGKVKYITIQLEKIESHFGCVRQSASLSYVEHKTRLVAICDSHKIEL